jgi:secreted PhoX family phosphatase
MSARRPDESLIMSMSPIAEIEVVNMDQEDRLQMLAHEAFIMSIQRQCEDFESTVNQNKTAKALMEHYRQGTLKANQINFDSIIRQSEKRRNFKPIDTGTLNFSVRGTIANCNKSPRPLGFQVSQLL